MRLISWNVNGIRSALQKGFTEFVAGAGADVLCLQEIRATQEQVDLELPGYRRFWSSGRRPGYAGTAVFTKVEPLSASYGMGVAEHDAEGRLMTLELSDLFLVNVYTPNSGQQLARLDYRTQGWDLDFLAYLRGLARRKPLVVCGDLNVAHQDIDVDPACRDEHVAGFTPLERANFRRLLEAGFIDTFRQFVGEGGHYTYWNYRTRARQRNCGWRIDYFLISTALRPRLRGADILCDVMGSDHCPVGLALD